MNNKSKGSIGNDSVAGLCARKDAGYGARTVSSSDSDEPVVGRRRKRVQRSVEVDRRAHAPPDGVHFAVDSLAVDVSVDAVLPSCFDVFFYPITAPYSANTACDWM